MPDTHASRRSVCALALCFVLSATLASAQPAVADARKLYLDAEYEESLALLTQLTGGTTDEQNEIATYRMFCLVALGRNDDAGRVVEAIVSADPFYQPAEDMASPRIREVFRQARRRALPDIARREYAAAKLAFDRKDPAASAMFERVLKLLADPDLEAPVTRDLRVLAEGFRDLSRTFATAAAPAPPVAQTALGAQGGAAASPDRTAGTTGTTPARATAPVGDGKVAAPPVDAPAQPLDPLASRPAREGDPGVVPPVVISQVMPPWVPPAAGLERLREFSGVIEVLIDQRGTVIDATIRASVHPQYDPELLRAARTWKYKPATRNGRPLPFAKLVEVRLRPAAR